MTETDLGVGTIILALAIMSLIDFIVVTVSVWVAAWIFRYDKKGWKTASRIAIYSLKAGLVIAAPFVLALYITHPALEDILAKGPRLLLPVGLVFIVKTAAIFSEMKKVYGIGIKKTVNGYATAAYLIICGWIAVILISSLFIGFYGIFSHMMGLEDESYDGTFTGWWGLSPELPGNYSITSSSYSMLFHNVVGEPIKINSALVIDVISEEECNVSSPSVSEQVDENGTFTLNAACPPVNISVGDPFALVLEINYTTRNNSLEPVYENDYVSGNASA